MTDFYNCVLLHEWPKKNVDIHAGELYNNRYLEVTSQEFWRDQAPKKNTHN